MLICSALNITKQLLQLKISSVGAGNIISQVDPNASYGIIINRMETFCLPLNFILGFVIFPAF